MSRTVLLTPAASHLLQLILHHCLGLARAVSNLAKSLNQLDISHNHISGNLNALAKSKLMYAGVHTNSELCGMVPGSVR